MGKEVITNSWHHGAMTVPTTLLGNHDRQALAVQAFSLVKMVTFIREEEADLRKSKLITMEILTLRGHLVSKTGIKVNLHHFPAHRKVIAHKNHVSPMYPLLLWAWKEYWCRMGALQVCRQLFATLILGFGTVTAPEAKIWTLKNLETSIGYIFM